MGSQMTKIGTLFEFGYFLLDIYILSLKIDGFRNPLLKIDGFPGTHGTHANGVTECVKRPQKHW